MKPIERACAIVVVFALIVGCDKTERQGSVGIEYSFSGPDRAAKNAPAPEKSGNPRAAKTKRSPDSTFLLTLPDTAICEILDSEPQLREIFFSNGSPRERYFVVKDSLGNEVREGLYVSWYENGQKEGETTYSNGKEQGSFTRWYETGRKMMECTYEEGKEIGLYSQWYENGTMKMRGTMTNGRLEGIVTVWNEAGKERGRITIKDAE
jgi:hypothetical protein